MNKSVCSHTLESMNIIPFPLESKPLNDATFKVLKPHTQGLSVKQLQQDLNCRFRALGISDRMTVHVDGWFGHKTLAAVKYLQYAGGLSIHGQVTERVYAFITRGFLGLEVLSLGSTGTSVSAIKQMLYERNSLQLSLDDVFDSGMQQAVKQYQQDTGLQPDGIIGQKTWAAIVSARLNSPACITLVPMPSHGYSHSPSGSSQTQARLPKLATQVAE